MSQMIPFNQAQLPAFLQQAAGAASINQQAATGTGGNTPDSISIEGGRFSIFKGGAKVQTLGQLEMQVVIIHANPGITKTFYASAWNPAQDATAPDCSSDDGVMPRGDVGTPQCGSCAACPQNQFGSKINPQTQKQSKACTDKKSLAVVAPGAVDGDMYRFQVPAASLGDFGAFLRGLPNVPYYGVICEISFDTTATFPKVKFRPVGYVSAEQYAIIAARHETQEAKAIAGVAGATAMRAPAQQALAAPPAHLQQPAPQQIPVQQVYVEPQPVYQQAVQQPAAQPSHTVVAQPVYQHQQHVTQPLSNAPAPQDPSIAAIFGGQAAAQQVQQPVAQQAQTVQQGAGNVHPSGREYGKPPVGKKRRTKAEMAEDVAVGIGAAPGEQSEEDDAQAAQQQMVQQPVQQAAQVVQTGFGAPAVEQPVQTGFGAPVQAVQQTYQQPVNQPQVVQGAAVDAFAGWDD